MRSGLTRANILTKGIVLLSLVGMGFLFQNCGGSGSGGSPSLGDSPIANDGSGGDPSNSGSGPPSNEGSLPGDGSHSGTPPNPGSTPISSGGGSNSDDDSSSVANSGPSPVRCIDGFVGVPGDDFYETQDFCVMKYEAKALNNAGTAHSAYGCGTEACASGQALNINNYKPSALPENKPWVRIKRDQAIAECQSMGQGYDLITNDQWQTLARNIELVPGNWSSGTVSNGAINRGHSDGTPDRALAASSNDIEGCAGTGQENTCNSTGRSQKRTHFVSNRGEQKVIWDIGSNVWEWMKDTNGTWNPTTGYSSGESDYGIDNDTYVARLRADSTDKAALSGGNTTTPRNAKNQFGPSGNYTHLNSGEYGGLGVVSAEEGLDGGLLRGGFWSSGEEAGPFAIILELPPSYVAPTIGFRCVTSPLSQ